MSNPEWIAQHLCKNKHKKTLTRAAKPFWSFHPWRYITLLGSRGHLHIFEHFTFKNMYPEKQHDCMEKRKIPLSKDFEFHVSGWLNTDVTAQICWQNSSVKHCVLVMWPGSKLLKAEKWSLWAADICLCSYEINLCTQSNKFSSLCCVSSSTKHKRCVWVSFIARKDAHSFITPNCWAV